MVDHDYKSKKHNNSLTIRLTESAVFLRTDETLTRRGCTSQDRQVSLLRGLLIVDLVKPTKITNIEVDLTATTSTAWPEGIGHRRIEINEEHRVFHANTTYFKAGKTSSTRRTASIGPGISYSQIYSNNLEDSGIYDDVEESDWDARARRRSSSTRSRSASRSGFTYGGLNPLDPEPSPNGQHSFLQTLFNSGGASSNTELRNPSNRHSSVDGMRLQRMPTNGSAEADETILARQMAPIPPYSPSPISQTTWSLNPTSPVSPTTPISHALPEVQAQEAARSLEDFRNSLHSNLRNSQHFPIHINISQNGSTNSLTSHQRERSVSRHPSVGEVIHENPELEDPTPTLQPQEFRSPSSLSPIHIPIWLPNSSPQTQSHRSRARSPIPLEPWDSTSSYDMSSPQQHQNQQRGHHSPELDKERHGSRFTFQNMSNMLMHVVRPSSPRTSTFRASRERDEGRAQELSLELRSNNSLRRGRTMDRGLPTETPTVQEAGHESISNDVKDRGRGVIGGMLKKDEKVEEWKEFKKGTYTYPISFRIPSNAPPTMICEFGSVRWQLKASVHRPGAFKPKMTATREVQIITCPTEEDTEDTENIIVERHWEQQLQYLISISGRSFYIGGSVPVSVTLMPLAKVKIHRLSVCIEERVDYYTHMKRIARTDPVTRYSLLSIKSEGKNPEHILPLESDSPDALRNSPLFTLVDPSSSEAELSEIAASLMGPGPWTFQHDLPLPESCEALKFTNKNRRTNITVSHTLKVVMRVERGDDLCMDAKGQRKLFDIVVQTPVVILSCRCNPEWTSLPRYAEVFEDHKLIVPNCPCQVARMREREARANGEHRHGVSAALERMTSRMSTDSSNISATEGIPVDPTAMRSLRQMSYNEAILRSSNLFERLISGQESEIGEAPPAYCYASPRGQRQNVANGPRPAIS